MTPAVAPLGSDDRAALADLVARYALFADCRDVAALTGLFTADGVLVLPDPPKALGPVLTRTGHHEIARAMSSLDAVPVTLHALAGQVFDPGPEPGIATGKVACAAHHLTARAGEPSDLVWHLRYTDRYRREGGVWRIAERSIQIDWIETRPVRHWRGQGA
ncbi:nuclear transport factor 2 family protein [Streptosporangium sp. NPDC051023]|uniref:nuclear transport factor 2 family protein n=1 Tax=Streptosporangium sp. NPDC051023 TaxID=3155410 RepID=UPI00344C2BAB